MLGRRKQDLSISEFDQLAQIHDGNPVTDVFHDTYVVRYEQIRQSELSLQIFQ